MRVCILFNNFGPYHIARIAALSGKCTVLPIEVNEISPEYLWGHKDTPAFGRTTLVPAAEAGTSTKNLICRRLRENLDRLRPDVVLVAGWWEAVSLAAIQWARGSAVPAILMSESSRHDQPRFAHREFCKRQVVRLCSAAIVGGASHARYLQELGMDAGCIADGYDAVDNEHFTRGAQAARSQAESTREALQLPPNYFLASSRLIPRKNLLRLIAAYDLYRQRVERADPWSLVILGYGNQERELRAAIERGGLTSQVKLAGFQPYDRLPLYYGLAGAFIHPALSEPWGLVVNEAMAAGLPAIVSKTCGCAPDLVTDGETGFQFDAEDVNQLSRLMTRVSQDEELRMRLARQAELRIREWSPERFANNLVRIAEAALDGKGNTRSKQFLARACLRTLLLRAS